MTRIDVVGRLAVWVMGVALAFGLGMFVGKRQAKLELAGVRDPLARIEANDALHEKLTFYSQLGGKAPAGVAVEKTEDGAAAFTLQVASFATQTEAQNYAAALEQKGLSPYIVSGKGLAKVWHRVRLGQFATLDEAQAQKEKLARARIAGWIVKTEAS